MDFRLYIRSLHISVNTKHLSWFCLLGVIFFFFILCFSFVYVNPSKVLRAPRINCLGEHVWWERVLLGKGPSLHSGPTFAVCLTVASHLHPSEPLYLLLWNDNLLPVSSFQFLGPCSHRFQGAFFLSLQIILHFPSLARDPPPHEDFLSPHSSNWSNFLKKLHQWNVWRAVISKLTTP